jgi:hypothetical protein
MQFPVHRKFSRVCETSLHSGTAPIHDIAQQTAKRYENCGVHGVQRLRHSQLWELKTINYLKTEREVESSIPNLLRIESRL